MTEEFIDQEVNSFNADILPQLDTIEKRLNVATTICKRAFNVLNDLTFEHLKCFDKHSETDKPSIYWVYSFKVEGLIFPATQEHKLCTITLANYGGVEFCFHSFNVKYLNI